MKTSLVYPRNLIALLATVFLLTISPFPVDAQLPVVKDGEKYVSPFATIFEAVSPAVVKITVTGEVEQRQRRQRFPFNMQQQDNNSTRPYEGMGSGVIVDRDGHILTNNHVIVNPQQSVADEIIVTLNDNEEYAAEVVGRDPDTDLAIVKLKLDGKKLPENLVAKLGDSDKLKPGDYAIAIGNPLGLERTITVGIVSALGRHKGIFPRGANLKFKNFIQTDALINPGNSGGALLNIDGEVIGINDIYIADSGIGFAIPINLAKNVMKQIIETGVVKRGAVGIIIKDVLKDYQDALDLPDREGVWIEEVLPGTPAEKAGLKRKDVIISLNGEKLKNSNEFQLKVGNLPPDATIKIAVIHEGKISNMTLKLGDRDEMLAESQSAESWRGINVVDLLSSQAQAFKLTDIESGVVVTEIEEKSPADDTALAPGDVIVEINNDKIENINDFTETRDKLKNSKKTILIYRLRKQPNGRIDRGFVAVKSK